MRGYTGERARWGWLDSSAIEPSNKPLKRAFNREVGGELRNFLPITEVHGLRKQMEEKEVGSKTYTLSFKYLHVNTFRMHLEQSYALCHLLWKTLGIE